MATRTVLNNHQHLMAQALHAEWEPPYTVTFKAGVDRSLEQNRLAFKWYGEMSEQLGDMSTAEYHAFCKLHYGVPILRAEDDEWRQVYDEAIKPLPYETKIKAIAIMPVTSHMTTKQMTQYLDAVYEAYTAKGVLLTRPESEMW
jgi:hypothetical protein